MIEQFYDLRPEVLALDRKALDLCRAQFAMWRRSGDYNQLQNDCVPSPTAASRHGISGGPAATASGTTAATSWRRSLPAAWGRAALVRPQFMSGTHTLTVALFGLLRTGDTLLAATAALMTRWKASSASETRARAAARCGSLA